MGQSHATAEYEAAEQRRKQRLDEAPKKKPRGHGRGKTVLHQRGGSPELRGVPLIGTGAGAVSHSAPGGEIGQVEKAEQLAKDLNDAGRKIVRDRSRYRSA